jgi:hypothetical protein
MSHTSVVTNVPDLPDADSAERRSDQRYPIALQLQYKLIGKSQIQRLGFGRTVNISSHGVLFELDDVAPASGQMELALNWPFMLEDSCGLKLVIRGNILRTEEKIIALKAEFHEFRTARRSFCERPAAMH